LNPDIRSIVMPTVLNPHLTFCWIDGLAVVRVS